MNERKRDNIGPEGQFSHLNRRKPQRPGQRPVFERPSLRDEIAGIDQEILRLLLKRDKLMAKIRQKGRIFASDEKFLREKWQETTARVSKDALLSNNLFALIQEINFLPKEDKQIQEGSGRTAFILKPIRKSLDFGIDVPPDTHAACAWAYMAVASGNALKVAPAPDNAPTRDCVNGFTQMGARISRDKDRLEIYAGAPLATPDIVLYAGESEFNFFLFLAHYLGRHSRVKINGEKLLKINNYSALRHFLPTLGTRMVHVIPRSEGLPVRLESSGLLPPGILATPDLPAGFFEALLLASPFYEQPFCIDFTDYPARELIFAHIIPILEQCGVTYSVTGAAITVAPSSVHIPDKVDIGMDPVLAAFMLALPQAVGGRARLDGHWAKWPECRMVEKCFAQAGGNLQIASKGLQLVCADPLRRMNEQSFCNELPGQLEWLNILLLSLSVCVALRGGEVKLPEEWKEWRLCGDFLHACGLFIGEHGVLASEENVEKAVLWNAPDAAWALAFAVCASARTARTPALLGNPNIISELWIPFWNWFNTLTRPPKSQEEDLIIVEEPKSRRRIITSAEAILPEPRPED